MATTKKPRRPYRPMRSLTNPLAAFTPLPKALADKALLQFYAALESITKGTKPDEGDWRVLSDVVNLVETMATRQVKLTEGLQPLLETANRAMADAGKRWNAGLGMQLIGDDLQSVREVVDVYAQALRLLSEREMDFVRRVTEARLSKIVRRGAAPGQEVVMV